MESELAAITFPQTHAAPARRSLLTLALPASARLGMRARATLAAGMLALVAAILTDTLHLLLGFGGAGLEAAMRGPVIALGITVAAAMVVMRALAERRHRALWWVTAAGASSYAIGSLLWNLWLMHMRHPPNPSIADFFWRGFYPLIGTSIVVAGSRRARRGATTVLWLDGLIAASATAALGATFVLPEMLHTARGAHQAIITDFQYPIGDLVLWVLLVTITGIRGWHVEASWSLFTLAITLLLVGDFTWATQITQGATTGNSASVLAYLSAFLLLAAGCWQFERRPRRRLDASHWSTLILPTIFTITAPGILIYDRISRVSTAAFVCAMLALAAAMLRTAMVLRDRLALAEMSRAALTDDLTELANRRMYFARLREAITGAAREGTTVTGLMFDLDNFKQLNDTLGHDAGDELLRMVGRRLAGALQRVEVVARLGGDEFAVLLAHGAQPQLAHAVATQVLATLREPFAVHGVTLRLTASIGIASYPADAADAEALIKCMDVAMYEAKRSRRGFELYVRERDMNTPERLELADALAGALENGGIEAHFQPILDTVTRRVVGAEALVRWRLPDGSLRPPADFLEAAERSGLSRQLTRRMLELALAEVRHWREIDGAVFVSVNATAADLLDETFAADVRATLERHGVDPCALAIEVTESSFLADPGRAGLVLQRLRALGVRLALDDFGTGYSSLTHLRELPVHTIKIDRSFVARMCDAEQADAAIVYATIELAHRLGLAVVAEGVEDQRTWESLALLGCERVQGYAGGRPCDPQAFRARLRQPPEAHFAESQSLPIPTSTASGGSIS